MMRHVRMNANTMEITHVSLQSVSGKCKETRAPWSLKSSERHESLVFEMGWQWLNLKQRKQMKTAMKCNIAVKGDC